MERNKDEDGDEGGLTEFAHWRERASAQMLDGQNEHVMLRILRLMTGLEQRRLQLPFMAPSDCEALLRLLRECEAIFQETHVYPGESG